MTIGVKGQTGELGSPFNRPTRAVMSPAGEIFVGDGYGVDDRPFITKVRHYCRVGRGGVHGKGDVVPTGRAHILDVIPILDRKSGAVEGQLSEVRIPAVLRIQRGRSLQGVRLLPKLFADGRARCPKSARGGMQVTLGIAGDGSLATYVDRFECVKLARIRYTRNHAELLLYAGVRRGRLHSAKVKRQTLILIKVWKEAHCRASFSRKY